MIEFTHLIEAPLEKNELATKLLPFILLHGFNLEKAVVHLALQLRPTPVHVGTAKEYETQRLDAMNELIFFWRWFFEKGHLELAEVFRENREQIAFFIKLRMHHGLMGEKTLDATIYKLYEKTDMAADTEQDGVLKAVEDLGAFLHEIEELD